MTEGFPIDGPGTDGPDTDGPAPPTPSPPAPPPDADTLFGAALPDLVRYVGHLTGPGTVRGLLGPREVPRLWSRHIVNCAAIAPLVPTGARLVDLGTGAGLPGLVLALVRPDLTVTLLDATARRTQFLGEVVADLGLGDRVRVVTGRVEAADVRRQIAPADVVTARAVTSLATLAAWCLPLLTPDGRVLAMKGAAARDEVAAGADDVRRRGARIVAVHDLPLGDQTTTVVEMARRARARAAKGTR